MFISTANKLVSLTLRRKTSVQILSLLIAFLMELVAWYYFARLGIVMAGNDNPKRWLLFLGLFVGVLVFWGLYMSPKATHRLKKLPYYCYQVSHIHSGRWSNAAGEPKVVMGFCNFNNRWGNIALQVQLGVRFRVPKEGIEPPWYCYHTILSRARLPVPPLRLKVALL
jgi:hypothetical protein